MDRERCVSLDILLFGRIEGKQLKRFGSITVDQLQIKSEV